MVRKAGEETDEGSRLPPARITKFAGSRTCAAPPVGVPRLLPGPLTPGAPGLAAALDDRVEVSETLEDPVEPEDLTGGDPRAGSVPAGRGELPHPAHSRITGRSAPANRRLTLPA